MIDLFFFALKIQVYEQALMVRKVKSYLDGLKVVDTESELDRLSYDIEPQQSGMAWWTAKVRLCASEFAAIQLREYAALQARPHRPSPHSPLNPTQQTSAALEEAECLGWIPLRQSRKCLV